MTIDRASSDDPHVGPVTVTVDRSVSNMRRAAPAVGAKPIRFGKR